MHLEVAYELQIFAINYNFDMWLNPQSVGHVPVGKSEMLKYIMWCSELNKVKYMNDVLKVKVDM